MTRLACALLLCFSLVTLAFASNWPNWRGPSYDGVASGTGYPTKWSATENVRWKVQLPGPGASTPILWGDRIFLTCVVDGKNTAVCLDRGGKIVWQTPIGKTARAGKNQKATGSNPSAVTDGEHVFVYFKSGDLACLDFSGKVLWEQNLQTQYGEDTLWWDLGTSPVLTKDCVVVAVMHSGPSFVVAFDKASGKVAWKQDRQVEAPEESAHAYTTPVVLNDGGSELLIVLGADHVTTHDAATGSELWRVGGLNPKAETRQRSIASAVIHDGIVIAPYDRGHTLTAIKLGGSGDVTDSHVVWVRDDLGADVPTPAALDGKIYVCGDRGKVTCLDVKTGKTLAEGQAPQHRTAYSSSPVVADGKLYIAREDGTTFVLSLDGLKVLAENKLGGEQTVATPVFADGQILLRTRENLYCIGK
jgi:outer membrane protein assembly factor BamB